MDSLFGSGKIPSSYLIGANDEHGLNPTAAGKRTPVMPYINRRIYDNEFNKEAKKFFIEACKRTGFNVFDVKPEINDIPIAERRKRIENANPDLLVTFGYNTYKTFFNTVNGIETAYSKLNSQAENSEKLAEYIYYQLITGTDQNGRGVSAIDLMVTATVAMPAVLVEAGFMTNIENAKLMLDPDYQKAIGEFSCAGVCNFLGVPFTPEKHSLACAILKKGSEGKNVIYLQQKLYAKLYDPKGTDGIFGNNTENALKEFQRENGLFDDGIAGELTWAALIPFGGKRI